MDSYKSTLVKWGSNRLLVYDPTPYHAGYSYTTRLPNKQEYSTPIHRIHDEQVTKSCILWSGVLERSMALSLSDVVIIMLINVKTPTLCWHFNIYE